MNPSEASSLVGIILTVSGTDQKIGKSNNACKVGFKIVDYELSLARFSHKFA